MERGVSSSNTFCFPLEGPRNVSAPVHQVAAVDLSLSTLLIGLYIINRPLILQMHHISRVCETQINSVRHLDLYACSAVKGKSYLRTVEHLNIGLRVALVDLVGVAVVLETAQNQP